MTFKESLTQQNQFELLIARHISRRQKALIWPNGEGADSGKDFTLYKPEKVEVKCDFRAESTGNFYFEIFNTRQNRPSGIAATQAEVVYHFVPPNRLFSYCPRFLHGALTRLVSEGKAKVVEGGDNNSRGIVMRVEGLSELGFVTEETFLP